MRYKKYFLLLGSLFVLFLTQPVFAVKYKLYVFTTPDDATVRIENIRPKFKQGIELKPDKYEVQVKKDGYITYWQEVTIDNANKIIEVQLVPKESKKYRLYIKTVPEDAQVRLLNSNQEFQLGIALEPGQYPIEISSPNYNTIKPVIEIKNKDVHLGFELKPKKIDCTQSVETHDLSLHIKPSNTQITIRNLQPGKHEIDISEASYGTKKLSVEITDKDVSKFVNLSSACHLSKNGANNISVSINGHTLRFVKIDSGNIDDIALREKDAKKFHEAAQQMKTHSSPFPPFIFRAVSEDKMPKVVPAFWVQETTISSQLYQEIVPTGLANKVSYKSAKKVIETLNQWCNGKAKFDLPVEKQFVYLAKQIYDPIKNGSLKPCHKLKNLETSGIKHLLGNKWQLTKSKCDQFDIGSGDVTRECDDRMYVTKGGTTGSKNATECMPEYRGTSSPNVDTPNTTFRLVLDEYK